MRSQHGALWSITSEGVSQFDMGGSRHRTGGGAGGRGGIVIIYHGSVFSLYLFLHATFYNASEITQLKKLKQETPATYHLNIS